MSTTIYVDGNNLYRAAKGLGFEINYKNLNIWLRQRYGARKIYLFIGYIEQRANYYQYLEKCGFILVFKQTLPRGDTLKGNCDAELVLKVITDYFIREFYDCVIITGDGDFGCLIEFLRDKKVLNVLISPDKNRCSLLLKNKFIPITYLNEHYHKFASQNERAPDADASA